MPTSKNGKPARALEILRILSAEYPDAKPHLDYRSPFELLTATILAAQCTDEMVNKVTPELFRRYPDPASLAAADPTALEALIRSTGFYRNKARSLLAMAGTLVERFGGRMPQSVEELTELPGVGRKTANVVAANCFGVPAIIVDTHLKRLAGRLELSGESDPDKIERELWDVVPEGDRTRFSAFINEHGRRVCSARKPRCPECRIAHLCPYPEKTEG
ncbi:MAG: endonuclease III [Spirochaetales bacterium]|nr:endonuclease III [Spirochaetales bacterium]